MDSEVKPQTTKKSGAHRSQSAIHIYFVFFLNIYLRWQPLNFFFSLIRIVSQTSCCNFYFLWYIENTRDIIKYFKIPLTFVTLMWVRPNPFIVLFVSAHYIFLCGYIRFQSFRARLFTGIYDGNSRCVGLLTAMPLLSQGILNSPCEWWKFIKFAL